ncbi:MAG: HD-GYP domain-containing protein [Nitrospirota bacterium]
MNKIVYESNYVTVSIDEIAIDERLACDIFIKDHSIIQPLFYRGTVFDVATRDLLRQKGIEEVYLRKEDVTDLDQRHSDRRSEDNHPTNEMYSLYKVEYYQVDRNVLIPGKEVNFSLFVLYRGNLIPFIESGNSGCTVIPEGVMSIIGDIMIKNADIPLYHDYLVSLNAADLLGKVGSRQTTLVLRENSKIVVKSLLDNPRSGEKIKEINVLVNKIIDLILDNRNAFYDLISLRDYDYYTYTHSVNVAVLSLGLGTAIGLERKSVEKLGMGAMLHDIGKSVIPHSILNKMGRLTEEEYEVIKSHVIEGERILSNHKGIPAESVRTVLEHHERLLGKGYPHRLSGDKISLFGRISAIVDVYDAMTTERPYRPAYTPFYALLDVTQQRGLFDPDILIIFIKMIGKC